jgi:ankyrin repeat protein
MKGACNGSTEVVLLLLKAGARINFQNKVSKIMYVRYFCIILRVLFMISQ